MATTGIIDRKNQEKLYIQIMRLVVDEIGRGTWSIGDRIPSEDELAVRYGVSKITIRQALTNLAADGYLMKVQGKGTFVAGNRPVVGLTMKTRFTEGLFGRGVQETREVLERGVVEPPAEVGACWGLRGRSTGSPPGGWRKGCRSLRTSRTSRRACCPGSRSRTSAGFALFAAIQERGTRKVFRMRQTVEITGLTAREAADPRGGRRGSRPWRCTGC